MLFCADGEIFEVAARFEQLFVFSDGFDFTLGQENDFIEVFQNFDFIDGEDPRFFLQVFEKNPFHYFSRRLGVEGRKTIVDQIDIRVVINASSQLDSLDLAAGEVYSPFAHFRELLGREFKQVICELAELHHLFEPLLVEIQFELDIVSNRVVHKERLL